MRLRPYRLSDAECIGQWIDSEWTNALWCANSLPYPLDAQAFEQNRLEGEKKWSNSCFIATDDYGKQIGYFHMSINDAENSAFLGYVIVNKEYRGKGYGQEMIGLAKKYAFEIANLRKIRLFVFDKNEAAVKCYQRNGFEIVEHQENAFSFEGTVMSRYIMEVFRDEQI